MNSLARQRAYVLSVVTAVSRKVVLHVKNHVGVGIVCSVAYFDPGNWSVDLQAGSTFGYRPMLFVVLMAGLGAIVLQTLACKLGCVTGIDLASHCRLLLHDRPKHTRLIRYAVLYPLYVISEIAIISTDLAELLGSAIGFTLLIPRLPLWAGVVMTAADVLIFLAIADPSRSQGRPAKVFELSIIALVLVVFCCFAALLAKANPHWPSVFAGYLPSKHLFQSEPDAIYTSVGILGATVMPHALFLGSSLATQDRVSLAPPEPPALPGASYTPSTRRTWRIRIKDFVAPLFRVSRAERLAASRDYRSKYGERENNSPTFIQRHLSHGIADIVTSLLGIAMPINSSILILAATVFFFRGNQDTSASPAGLFDAYELIHKYIGQAAAIVFALALICAGQASSITATLAGQIVSEGFIEWRISPFFRRLITRLISLIPSVVVAVAFGREGINTLLVASQVILSVVLPFIAFPLVYLTSTKVVMRVRAPQLPLACTEGDSQSLCASEKGTTDVHVVPAESSDLGSVLGAHAYVEEVPTAQQQDHVGAPAADAASDSLPPPPEKETTGETASHHISRYSETAETPSTNDFIDYSNGWVLGTVAYTIWTVVLVANVYALVMLGSGKSVT